MHPSFDFKRFQGIINEVHLACHSIVLELESGLRLAIEGDATFVRGDEAPVPLRNEVGNLCGKQVIRSVETKTGDLRIELLGGSWIKIEVARFDDGGDWPIFLLEPIQT
jgi:hypothetical protein